MEKQSLNFMNPRYKIIDVQDRSMFNISHINGAINYFKFNDFILKFSLSLIFLDNKLIQLLKAVA